MTGQQELYGMQGQQLQQRLPEQSRQRSLKQAQPQQQEQQIVRPVEIFATEIAQAITSVRKIQDDNLRSLAIAILIANPQLMKCTAQSIAHVILATHELNLSPYPTVGDVYIVPFYNAQEKKYMATMLLGYRGLIKLASRSHPGLIVKADVVYEGDELEYQKGTDEYIRHVPRFESENVTHVYAFLKLQNATLVEVISIDQANELRQRMLTRKETAAFSPWASEFWLEMVKKTLVRRLLKYLPLDTTLQRAIVSEEYTEAGIAVPSTPYVNVQQKEE
ncbi:MAG: recombinase RecT [Candidatus Methanomethylicaceae archaeon]